MFPFFQPTHLGGNYRANRAAIGGAICMSADIFIDRACVQTSTAMDPINDFALYGIIENICAAIVKEDHIHLARSVNLSCLPGTAEDRIVHRLLLACTESSKQRPEKAKIRQGRN